jgi:hydrogenase expression/formation protein HypC
MEVQMCLAVPAQIIEISGSRARVSLAGNVREVDLSLLEQATVGDWVLVHAGFALEKLSPEDAEETLNLMMQLQGDGGEEP